MVKPNIHSIYEFDSNFDDPFNLYSKLDAHMFVKKFYNQTHFECYNRHIKSLKSTKLIDLTKCNHRF